MLYFWQKQLTYNKIQLTIWQRGTENNFSIPLFFTLKNCQIKNCLSNISYLSSPKMRTNCGHAAQNKNPKQLVCKCLGFFTGTRSRGRTGTTLLSLVFETNASTDSAIRAHAAQQRIGTTKIGQFRYFSKNSVTFRNSPGFFSPATGRQAPPTPRYWPPAPSRPTGNAATASRSFWHRSPQYAPVHCE